MAMNSPVLLCNTGVFMFPDMMAPAPGYYVGVVLSSELPAADRQLFEDLLSQMTDLRVQVSVAPQLDLHQHNTRFDIWGANANGAYMGGSDFTTTVFPIQKNLNRSERPPRLVLTQKDVLLIEFVLESSKCCSAVVR